MALTVTDVKLGVSGNKFTRTLKVAFDSSYPTGGESLTKADMQFPDGVTVDQVQLSGLGGYTASYDYTNQKIIVYNTDRASAAAQAGQEVANTTNLSALTDVRIEAWGS